MKQLLINNKRTQDFYSDDVAESSIKNWVKKEYGDVIYSLEKVEKIKVSKYNFFPLLSGESVTINLPEKPTVRNGRKIEETNAREGAYRFAKRNGIKVTVSKTNDKLIVKLRSDAKTS